MNNTLTEKRDELIGQLSGQQGFISVGFARKDDKTVLLVAVDESFCGEVPGTFRGLGVITRELGEAKATIERGYQ